MMSYHHVSERKTANMAVNYLKAKHSPFAQHKHIKRHRNRKQIVDLAHVWVDATNDIPQSHMIAPAKV